MCVQLLQNLQGVTEDSQGNAKSKSIKITMHLINWLKFRMILLSSIKTI